MLTLTTHPTDTQIVSKHRKENNKTQKTSLTG